VLEGSGLPADKCDVHKQILGGGSAGAARPTMSGSRRHRQADAGHRRSSCLWSREEDMLRGRYHPVTQCKMTAALDADNNLTALHMRISGQSILFSLRPEALVNGKDPATFAGLNPDGDAALGYSIPNLLIEHSMRNPHIIPGFWRGVNVNHNALYLECFHG